MEIFRFYVISWRKGGKKVNCSRSVLSFTDAQHSDTGGLEVVVQWQTHSFTHRSGRARQSSVYDCSFIRAASARHAREVIHGRLGYLRLPST